MDFDSCYSYLCELLHPTALHCSCGQKLSDGQKPHKSRKNGLPCYKCRKCQRIFNISSGTILSSIHYDYIKIVLMIVGFAQGVSTIHLSKELELNYGCLLTWRHKC